MYIYVIRIFFSGLGVVDLVSWFSGMKTYLNFNLKFRKEFCLLFY